jgi:peptide chain release factor 1
MTPAQWDEVKNRHDALAQELANPKLDTAKRLELQKEFSSLHALFTLYKEVQALEKEHADVVSQAGQSTDPEMRLLFDEELQMLDKKIVEKKQELDDLLYPPSPHDSRSVFLEIRAGTGGQEAALFASDLHTMYTNYALKKGWKVSVESSSSTDLGGFREIVLHIKGKGVFKHLKYESGVHRVQRVPSTETSGRIHTSTATVAVLPEAEEVDVSINPADLRIDVYRASGAGGQHVNTTDSAVRITHIPTGVVVACQDERSQHKNKAKAMKLLQSRILAAQIEKQHEQMSKQRKELVGSGMRAEKVRTYNYPQNRVTDHQVDMTWNKLDMIMQGDLDEIIQALLRKEYEERRNLRPTE